MINTAGINSFTEITKSLLPEFLHRFVEFGIHLLDVLHAELFHFRSQPFLCRKVYLIVPHVGVFKTIVGQTLISIPFDTNAEGCRCRILIISATRHSQATRTQTKPCSKSIPEPARIENTVQCNVVIAGERVTTVVLHITLYNIVTKGEKFNI